MSSRHRESLFSLRRVKGKEKGPLSAEGIDQSNGNDSHFRACRRKRSCSPHASRKNARTERVRGALLSLFPVEFPVFSLSLSLSLAIDVSSRQPPRNSLLSRAARSLLSSAKERRTRMLRRLEQGRCREAHSYNVRELQRQQHDTKRQG